MDGASNAGEGKWSSGAEERIRIGWAELAKPNIKGDDHSMKYRRAHLAGGTYFFTVNLAERSSTLLVDRIADLRRALRVVKERHSFDILAWVVLPDHLHAIWTLPAGDGDCAMRWMLIKSGFTRCIERVERVRASRVRKRERSIWQRRFWEHVIRNDDDLHKHVDYVHINPVKHGHAARASEWPYSSIHEHIRLGWAPEDWAAPMDDEPMMGEG